MADRGLIRAFLAVPADAAWGESARELTRRLRSELPDASWTRPESWHLTLYFLGEITQAAARRFASAISEHAAATSEGDLTASGAVVFPPRGPARVLGVGFVPSAFTDAVGKLATAASHLAPSTRNSKLETRNFHPHVSFARIRRPWPREAVERYRAQLSAWRPPAWRAGSCVLFQSRLDPAGAVHTPIHSFSFGPPQPGSQREESPERMRGRSLELREPERATDQASGRGHTRPSRPPVRPAGRRSRANEGDGR